MDPATILVIFGASGDLTRRKLIPALYNLHRKGRLPARFHLLGAARSPGSDAEFREKSRTGLTEFAPHDFDSADWQAFAQHVHYLHGDFAAADSGEQLARRLAELAGDAKPPNLLFYLAIPPDAYAPLVEALGRGGLADDGSAFRRLVVEKPFGSDLATARSLNQTLHSHWREDQIYRIDHYLGKETVQNVLFFRFANSIFEPVWNRNYIDHVQITVAESVGIEHRGRFYDSVGVLRDVFQNHVLQLLAMMAMEPPASFDPEALRDERQKVLRAVRPMAESEVGHHTVRAQYTGYQDEDGVASGSPTATYGLVRLYIDNWRWQGVPFYLRSGKHLEAKTTQITIQFKSVPHVMFPLTGQEFDSSQRPVPVPAARRGDPPAIRGQGARQHAPLPLGRHGIPLRRGFRADVVAGRLRTSAAGCPQRGRLAVHARRRDRIELVVDRSDPARLGERHPRVDPLPAGRLGPCGSHRLPGSRRKVVGDGLRRGALVTGAGPPGKIRIFGTTWCGQCLVARMVFARNGVDYDWVDIDGDPAAEELVLRHNGGMRSVPTILFPQGDLLVEPSVAALQERLRRSLPPSITGPDDAASRSA